MVLTWITVNSRLQEAIILINSISQKNFNFLLEHITQSRKQNILAPDELVKLANLLNLNATKAQLLLQSVLYIFQQSSKIVLKPTVLHKQLTEELKFDADKAEVFVKFWTNEAKDSFGNLEERQNLGRISWQLNLQSASDINFRETIPNARIQLGLKNINNEETKNVTFEMNEEELLQFYSTLENIQNKLDFVISAKQ